MLLDQLKTKPKFVRMTRDMETGRQFVHLTFEYSWKVSGLGGFLQSIREDLWANGLYTSGIRSEFTAHGIEPAADPAGVAFPVFNIQSASEMQEEHDSWLAAVADFVRERR